MKMLRLLGSGIVIIYFSEIDAMSSASAMSETAPLARSISDKVLDIIESQDNP